MFGLSDQLDMGTLALHPSRYTVINLTVPEAIVTIKGFRACYLYLRTSPSRERTFTIPLPDKTRVKVLGQAVDEDNHLMLHVVDHSGSNNGWIYARNTEEF